MAEYQDMYLVRTDGTISDHTQTIQVDVDVVMAPYSTSSTARWGQTIGTTGMADCHGLLVINNTGAWLAHHWCTDAFNVPAQFQGGTRVYLLGTQYPSTGWASGRSNYAFFLNPSGQVSIYVSGVTGRAATSKVPKSALDRSSDKDGRDKLSGSGEYTFSWDKYDIPDATPATEVV